MRRNRVEFRGVVDRIAPSVHDVVITDIRRADGRIVLATGWKRRMPLVLRVKFRTHMVVGYGGYGGEMKAEADTWDH